MGASRAASVPNRPTPACGSGTTAPPSPHGSPASCCAVLGLLPGARLCRPSRDHPRATRHEQRDAAAYIDETHNFLNLPGSITELGCYLARDTIHFMRFKDKILSHAMIVSKKTANSMDEITWPGKDA
ncbi:hypothetical protein [Actinomadura formosensis]|uniref:hypothetical protein n=1 Tax=Actinomadura formosensis TaxID=60706 RepID=UPI003D8B40D6